MNNYTLINLGTTVEKIAGDTYVFTVIGFTRPLVLSCYRRPPLMYLFVDTVFYIKLARINLDLLFNLSPVIPGAICWLLESYDVYV